MAQKYEERTIIPNFFALQALQEDKKSEKKLFSCFYENYFVYLQQ